MPNNPGSRRAGAAKVTSANKLQRGQAVQTKIDQAALKSADTGAGSVSGTPDVPPSGSAGGDLFGTYPNPTVAAIQGTPVNAAAPSVIGQALRFNGSAWYAGTPGDPYEFNVKFYGAVGDGVTDDTAAILNTLIAARFATVGVSRLVMTAFGNAYTGVPSVLVGYAPGSGFAGTPLVSNVGANGKVGTVKVTNRGSGYKIIALECGITSGNPVITCSNTTGIANGMNIDCQGIIPYGTTISSFTPNVDITLSANPTGSNGLAQVAVGVPLCSFSGGGGAGAAADVIIGDGVVVRFPPGVYRVTGNLNFTGLHSLRVVGYGATILADNANISTLVIDEFCRDIEFHGLHLDHRAAKYGNGAVRDPGCSARVAGDLISFINCLVTNSADFGILYTRDRTTGKMSYGGRIVACTFIGTCGDAIHASNSCGGLDIIDPIILNCGDDCIGIVADYGTGNEPQNITITGYNINGGGFRGMAILGAINVTIGPGIIQNVMGYGIEIGQGGGSAACFDILIAGMMLKNIGAGGPGNVYGTRHAMVFQNCNGLKVVGCIIDIATGYGYYLDQCTDAQIDGVFPRACTSGDFALGGGTITRFSHLYRAAGALKYRGEAGTVTAVAPT